MEMGFLGLAYGSVIRGDARDANERRSRTRNEQPMILDRNRVIRNRFHTWASLIIPPLVMFLSGIFGVKVIGKSVEGNNLLFLGTLSFGSTSLVYLVTEELLIEAKKNYAREATHQPNAIVIFIFIGLFISFTLSTTHLDFSR